jgi:TM2 domain-containing membrane protein YozV
VATDSFLLESRCNCLIILSEILKQPKLNTMESQKVDYFIISNSKYFESYHLSVIREKLLTIDDAKWSLITTVRFKDPTLLLIVSILIGSLGIDRFLIGDIGLGMGKLLTCGGLGIWYIIDLFLIQQATREKNMEQMQRMMML